MDPKLHESLEQFMREHNPKDMDEANELLQEFIKLYNGGELDYEDSHVVKAYELLEEASMTDNDKKREKLLKKALEIYPDCLEAKLILATDLERPIKIIQEYEKCLDEEKDRLTKEGYFSKDNIGIFYGIYETRPYITGMFSLANIYANAGMIGKSMNLCKEILRLNKNDNTGTRYILMGLYAFMEDINNMKKLYSKFKEENLHMLVPFLIYYYKVGNYKEALKYLERIKKVNKHFVSYFEDEKDMEAVLPSMYRIGDESEIDDVVAELEFLFNTVPDIGEIIIEKDI